MPGGLNARAPELLARLGGEACGFKTWPALEKWIGRNHEARAGDCPRLHDAVEALQEQFHAGERRQRLRTRRGWGKAGTAVAAPFR